jgi:serine O-acetyltransferase
MATDFRLKERLPELTDRIVSTYAEVGSIHHLGHCPLPNYDTIIWVIESLREILYPGYRRRDNLHLGNVTYHVGELIDRLHDTLTLQIARALCHEAGNNFSHSPRREDFEALGQAKTMEFLEQLPTLRKILALDVEAAYAGDPACKSLDEVIFCYPGLEAITVYRLAHLLHKAQVPLIPRMMTEWAHGRTGIDIHPGANIGKYFFIDHGTGVVIGETTDIGDWVKLYQGVTLGALSFPKDAQGNLVRGTKRHPTIEDRVVIYANATVLGGQTVIGHDSVIGSSAWITQSVSPLTTVTMEKPKLRILGEQQDELRPEVPSQSPGCGSPAPADGKGRQAEPCRCTKDSARQ